jgi:hypothetical protein
MSEPRPNEGRPCPRCGRDVPGIRRACLYCGESVPADATSRPPQSSDFAAPRAVSSTRALIIVDLSNANVAQVTQAFNIALADASLRIRRRGYQLLRITSIREAETFVTQLRRTGIAAWSLPEQRIDAGRYPVIIRGGDVAAGRFVLAENSIPIRVVGEDLLLAIWGRIHRTRHEFFGLERLRPRPSPFLSTLNEEHRLHLHRRLEDRPLEIDPGSFEFDDRNAAMESSLLRIRSGLESLMGHRTIDDAFRLEAPAMSPMQTPQTGVFAIVESLKDRGAEQEGKYSGLLYNLEQFRFYSAWRGALARAHSHD